MSKNRPAIDLVIFDCDGVLIDSEILSANVLIDQLAELNIDIDFDHVQKSYLGRSFPKVAAMISQTFDQRLPDDFEHCYRNSLLHRFQSELKHVSGIVEVLENLSIQYCVATSSSPARVNQSLNIVNLSRFFDQNIFTASEVKNGKPAPDLFLYVAKTINVNCQNCLVIEDSQPGVQAAMAAGMQVVRFVGGSHLINAQKTIKHETPNIKTFDNWQKFFDMFPQLKAQNSSAE